MNKEMLRWTVAVMCGALAACGGSEEATEAPAPEKNEAAKAADEHGHEHKGGAEEAVADSGEHEHGAVRHELGQQTVAGWTVTAHQADDVIAAGETVFYVDAEGAAKPAALRFWVGDEAATNSAKILAEHIADDRFHAHVEIPEALTDADQFWVEIDAEGSATAKTSFKLALGAVLPPAGPHTGFVVPVHAADGAAGFAELKLHDDKGDLEIWLAADAAITAPLDLPLDAAVSVAFSEKGKTVELRARNAEKNEDEDGKANIRDGKTNYFIFPGTTGADAQWLKGNFRSQAAIKFEDGGRSYASTPFTLVPHTHGPGGHTH